MKTFSYMGLRIPVQDWVTFIAMDRNGFIYGFRNEATFDTDANEWVFPSSADVHLAGTLHQFSGVKTSLLQIIIIL